MTDSTLVEKKLGATDLKIPLLIMLQYVNVFFKKFYLIGKLIPELYEEGYTCDAISLCVLSFQIAKCSPHHF